MKDWSFTKIENRLNDPLTRKQACNLTGISMTALYRWVQEGYLKTITDPDKGESILFTGQALIDARIRAAQGGSSHE